LSSSNKEITIHKILFEIIDHLSERCPLINRIIQDLYW
jgi:hypothetical protein